MTDYLVTGTIKYRSADKDATEVGPVEWSREIAAESPEAASEAFTASLRETVKTLTEVTVTGVTDLTAIRLQSTP